jgi:hypothetical protein
MNTRTKAFTESEAGKLAHDELTKMTKSKQYSTRTMYSTSDTNGMSFVDKHMKYMSQFPSLNYVQYVSNLKLMTKQK